MHLYPVCPLLLSSCHCDFSLIISTPSQCNLPSSTQYRGWELRFFLQTASFGSYLRYLLNGRYWAMHFPLAQHSVTFMNLQIFQASSLSIVPYWTLNSVKLSYLTFFKWAKFLHVSLSCKAAPSTINTLINILTWLTPTHTFKFSQWY